MSTPIIETKNLSKQYRLGYTGAGSLREDIERTWLSLFGKQHSLDGPVDKKLWALNNINFSVSRGEVFGIIGRNGAGKSTLLKLLSRVTEPTLGEAIIRGRTASLLEVGTGFHPELSGRDNIYLNGCLMGLSRKEVHQRFDQIVDFAGIGRFIDTPIKRYSSGMHVRLGFAIAAHLNPDIIIIDEVLAVGDSEFQKKCIDRIQEVAKLGGTVLFVSHNIHSILRLCDRCLMLQAGKCVDIGDTTQVVDHYLKIASRESANKLADYKASVKQGVPLLRDIKLIDAQHKAGHKLRFAEPFQIILHLEADALNEEYSLAVRFNNLQHEPVCASNTRGSLNSSRFRNGKLMIKVDCENRFVPGRYYATVSIWGHKYTELYEAILEFEIDELPYNKNEPFMTSHDIHFALKAGWHFSENG